MPPDVDAAPVETPAAPSPMRRFARFAARSLLGLTAFLVAGNLAITAAWQWEARTAPEPPVDVEVSNFHVVDERVWRGGAPGEVTYRDLAAHGVRTVVDLRAEPNLRVDHDLLEDLGIVRYHLPMRDGQAPTQEEVDTFLRIVRASDTPVYVHCGAGVGRTGTMVAAYRVARGEEPVDAMWRNLEVGPPSLEQLVFAASLDGADVDRVPAPVVAVSRVLDAPRRIWSRLRA